MLHRLIYGKEFTGNGTGVYKKPSKMKRLVFICIVVSLLLVGCEWRCFAATSTPTRTPTPVYQATRTPTPTPTKTVAKATVTPTATPDYNVYVFKAKVKKTEYAKGKFTYQPDIDESFYKEAMTQIEYSADKTDCLIYVTVKKVKDTAMFTTASSIKLVQATPTVEYVKFPNVYEVISEKKYPTTFKDISK